MASFAEKLGRIVNSTYVGFALTLSKDVGILQVLLEAEKPLTSQEIADSRGLKERYVRELLASLNNAELLHVTTNDTGSLLYHLEEDEKAAFRGRITAFISCPIAMMKAYEPLKSCFSQTGPKGMRISPEMYNFLGEYGSYNMDTYVETIMKCVDGLKLQLESGIDVLEVGCGRGHLLAKIAQMFPKSTFTASDNVHSLLDQQKANLGHLLNVRCDFIDLCSSDDLSNNQFDWIYCVNVIPVVPNPIEALKNIRKLMKPGATFTMVEFGTSGSPAGDRGNLSMARLYALSTFFSIPESFQREESHALGVCWGKQTAVDLATAAGFQVNTVDIEYPITLFVCK